MFCFAEDNKIISGLKNYNCGTGQKKKKDFQHTSGYQGLWTLRQPIVSLSLYMLGLSTGFVSIVHKISKLPYYFYNVRYNNNNCQPLKEGHYCITTMTDIQFMCIRRKTGERLGEPLYYSSFQVSYT